MKTKYILKRVLIAIPTFFGITILAYIISSMAPGSPLDMLLADPRMTAEEIARREVALGLDKPVIVGATDATRRLKDGVMVAVDCARGMVQTLPQ